MVNLKIDSHQHFWNYDPKVHIWMDDRMGVIKKDFLPADLKTELDKANLDGCVAVQASQTEEENHFLINLAARNDFIKGIVGWVDLKADNLEERLNYYKKFEIIKGFRHVIHDEPDVDFMLDSRFMGGVKLLKEYNYTYDLLIYPIHLENTMKFVNALPDQKFVIDHIAKPTIQTGANKEFWKEQLQLIAENPNLYIKVSGMVTEAKWNHWTYEDFVPYLESIVESFSPERIMYGSDWPVSNLSSNYQSMYEIVKHYFSSFSTQDQAQVFGLTAKNFYNLS
jgi:L-fuconolactonase